MAWFINRTGQPEGPFEDAQIIEMIQSGQVAQANICPQGGNAWMPIQNHPPFAQALQGGGPGAAPAGGGDAPPATMAMEAIPPGALMGGPMAPGGPMGGPGAMGPGAMGPGGPMGGPGGPGAMGPGGPMGGPGGPGAMGPGGPMGGPGGPGAMGPGGPMGGPGGPAQAMPPGRQMTGPGMMAPAGAAGGAAGDKKSPPIALIAGIGAGVLALVGVIVAVVMFMGGGSTLSKKVPADTELFIEVADVRGALAAAMDMEGLDRTEVDAKKRIEELRDGAKDAFGISEDDAQALVESIESVGMATRTADKDDRTAIVIAFGDSDGMEALLKSERFEKEGEVGGGTRYLVKRVEEDDFETIKEWSSARKMFSFLSYKEDSKRMLVWFEDAKILAMGHKTMIQDIGGVLDGDDESLADSEKWSLARREKGAATVFVDAELIDKNKDDNEDFEKFAKGYLNDVAPFTGTVNFTEAGMLMSAYGQLKGNKIDEDDAVPSPGSLEIYEKLPKETIAYMALSTSREEDGKAVKKRILKEMKGVNDDAAERVEKGLDELEEKLGVSLEDILDAVGDELVIALLVDEAYELDITAEFKDNLDQFGLVLMFEAGEEDKAKEVVDKLRKTPFDSEPLSKIYDVEKKDDGWNAVPKEEAVDKGIPPIKVRLANDHVLIAAGGSKLITAAAKALKGGENTLGDDAAHKAAIDAVSNKAHALVWLDAGRLGAIGLKWAEGEDKVKEELEEMEQEIGFTYKAFKVTGDKRLTSAISFRAESKGETMNWEIRSLNAPAFGVLAGFSLLRRFKRRAEPEPMPTGAGSGSGDAFEVNTGSSDCDALIRRLQSCSKEKKKGYIMDMAKSSHDAYKKSIDNAKGNKFVVRAVGRTCRDSLSKFRTRYTMCK